MAAAAVAVVRWGAWCRSAWLAGRATCGERPARDLGGHLLHLDAEPPGHGAGVLGAQAAVADAAMIGAAARMAWTRPSAVSRSKRLIVVRTANSNIGTASSTRARTAASPSAWRSSHGSMPSAARPRRRTAAAQRWSSPNALIAAFCPAASPSKVKMTLAGAASASSRMIRRSILMCSMPKAVPQVATAASTPDRWAAMTSV